MLCEYLLSSSHDTDKIRKEAVIIFIITIHDSNSLCVYIIELYNYLYYFQALEIGMIGIFSTTDPNYPFHVGLIVDIKPVERSDSNQRLTIEQREEKLLSVMWFSRYAPKK